MAKYAGPDKFADTTTSPPNTRFSVRRMARLLGVSRAGYYAHVKRVAATVLTPRQQRRADLEVKITQAHKDSSGIYGSPRITAELREQGEVVTAKTVAKIMASIGLEGISPRTFKVKTTVVDPAASFPPDLVDRHFDRDRLDAVWLTDITYLTCGQGDMFLCAIRDGQSRKVLGYSVSDHIGAEMVTDAIDAAVGTRGGRCRGTILHSDRGGEYTAHLTATACFRHGLRRSMGATGICWDNSPAESFWSTFKHEHYYRHAYATKTELVAAIDKWISFYNSTRRHSAIGMLSPDNFEQALRTAA
ncbi:IS3 family transposase [Amycolatopsis cihanbeyliensis]|uniref:Transposase InsO family protein n=1 Tax=Amycolatopsis cihanbeyliensis TaxID=1128664 RepID=A0A542DEY8_AMYCI|nr:IS3 family transposase [Amycolatopsis cihanbeyliensis]TQI94095.1 transposase InsO family protein [Amycolatopsis cihanbeyliensis]TQJ01095.1 transposase InsO family protein [Amycolatopsis cihanbeyliensis]TQJ01610.1 transposase InsO family protein [Amycolatopsis cihanbeyliensis]